MIDSFFSKPFWRALAILTIALGFSALARVFNFELFVLIAIFIFSVIVTAKQIEYGLAIAFLELMSGAHGFLFSTHFGSLTISLRMAIFFAVMGTWFVNVLCRRRRLNLNDQRLLIFLPLIVAVSIGFVIGIFRQSFADAFSDGNAYFYLAYLFPILSVDWDSLKKRSAFQILAAGAAYNSIITLMLFFLYSHFNPIRLAPLYQFVRDIRLAEITSAGFGFTRVFIQTQMFVFGFGFLLLLYAFEKLKRSDRLVIILTTTLFFTTLLLSLSRSFWIGVAGAFVIIILTLIKKNNVIGFVNIFISFIFSGLLIVVIALFPLPPSRILNFTNVWTQRTTQSDVAISSRAALLIPMLSTIRLSPVLGNGFGKTVTFTSDDPRARITHSDGQQTTYAMEWGWLELWLKMGILGPVSFLSIGYFLIKRVRKFFTTSQWVIGAWIIYSTIFIFITHIFSPYLNHPIGLGLLLFLMIFLPEKLLSITIPVVAIPIKKLQGSLATSITHSFRNDG